MTLCNVLMVCLIFEAKYLCVTLALILAYPSKLRNIYVKVHFNVYYVC